MMVVFCGGVAIGLIMTAPLGPVNVLNMHRTLQQGWQAGYMIGLGATLADTLFALPVLLGLRALSAFILDNQPLIYAVGGAVLLGFALVLFAHKPSPPRAPIKKSALMRSALTGFGLSLTNPANMLGFSAAFSSLAVLVVHVPTAPQMMGLLAGYICGALLWWGLQTYVVHRLRDRAAQRWQTVITRLVAGMFALLGVALLVRAALRV